MKKLNFGCGSIQPKDWINLDIEIDFNAPVLSIDEIEDNSLDIIVAHCAIQTNDYNDIEDLLTRMKNKLKDDGIIRISLPDIVKGFSEYLNGNIDWFPNGEDRIEERFCAWLTWYSTTRTLLTPTALVTKLRRVGFKGAHREEFKMTCSKYPESVELDTREGECYFIEATK